MTSAIDTFNALPWDQKVAAWWARGTLVYKLRDKWSYQLGLYSFLSQLDGKQKRVQVASVHRQFGKSNTAMLVCIETALRGVIRDGTWYPARITYLAPYSTQLNEYLIPIINMLLLDCPPLLKPKRDGQTGMYVFPNGSTINLDGVDGGHKETIRGRAADLVVIDEARDINELGYLIRDIVMPFFNTTKGRLIVISTPPRSPGHYFVDLQEEMKLRDAHYKRTAYDRLQDGSLSREQYNEWADQCGGERTSAFRREYLVENIVDDETAVVPEFTEEKESRLVKPSSIIDWQLPYYRPLRRWITMDPGRKDYTGILYGYADFRKSKLVIQKERVIKRMLVDDLLAALKQDQEVLWPGLNIDDVRRISDQNDVLFELAPKGMSFVPTSKVSKEEMVAKLRDWIMNERIQIDPSCTHLLKELRTAVWSKAKDKFIRPETGGHFDLLDALIYAVRNAQLTVNPYPDVKPDMFNQIMNPWEQERMKTNRGFEQLIPDIEADW